MAAFGGLDGVESVAIENVGGRDGGVMRLDGTGVVTVLALSATSPIPSESSVHPNSNVTS
jgi:hypothetical protein